MEQVNEALAGEPDSEKVKKRPGVALCLSGGGFRATLFCAGTLLRLNELGVLPKLRLITSVSGGSIVAALLGLRWEQLEFENDVAKNLEPLVIDPVRKFCSRRIALPAAVGGLFNPFKSIGDEMAEAYSALYGDSTLQDLPAGTPEFLLYATSMQTGRSVRMTRAALVDYMVGLVPNPDISLARAVGASSAFPPMLSPQHIKTDPKLWRDTKYSTLTTPEWRENLVLTDGGVYDNMGLEAAWQRYQTVLVCDAGAPFKGDSSPAEDWIRQPVRIMEIMTDQCRALRKRWLIDDLNKNPGSGAYWGIRTEIGKYRVPGHVEPLVPDSPITATLSGIRTNLDPFTEKEQAHLINWGYSLADAAIRRWSPAIANDAVGRLPVDGYPL